MFYECSSLTTTITNNTTSYPYIFSTTATNAGSLIKVNYTSETIDLVDKMIAIKSSNSNVVKGELIKEIDN